MSQVTDSLDPTLTGSASRQAYHAPRLRDYGHVREITRTNLDVENYSGDDGGSEPYVYVS